MNIEAGQRSANHQSRITGQSLPGFTPHPCSLFPFPMLPLEISRRRRPREATGRQGLLSDDPAAGRGGVPGLAVAEQLRLPAGFLGQRAFGFLFGGTKRKK